MKTIFCLISWTGVAALMTQPDPQFWVMLGVLCTSAASLISQRLTDRRIKQQHEWEEKQREWEKEDRDNYRRELSRDVKNVEAVTLQTKEEIKNDISHNTQITRAAADKADAAFEAANHVNDKIARLASDQAVKRIEAKTDDTNETAHRIEDKL